MRRSDAGDTSAGGADALEGLLDALIDRVPDRSEAVAALAASAYRRATAISLRRLGEDSDMAAARLVEAFRFMDARPVDALALRVFSPSAVDGWTANGTVVEVSVEDNPFLVSTVTEELGRLGYEVIDIIHPVVGVERRPDGTIARIYPARGAEQRESLIQIVLDATVPEDRHKDVEAALRTVLEDARAATRDFQAMRKRLDAVAEELHADAPARYGAQEIDEAAALLEWLLDDHFVLLGARSYAIGDGPRPMVATTPGSGLGILSDEAGSSYATPVPLDDVPASLRARMVEGDLLTVGRTNRKSTVQRQARMVYIGIKRVDPTGRIVGEHRLIGLFAQKAYAAPASSIPVLRRKLSQLLALEDVVDHSYDERALRSLFDAFPKHELFAASVQELRDTIVPLLETSKRAEVRLLCRVDPSRRGVSALVSVPRERFTAQIRMRVQELLAERFDTDVIDYHLSITDGGQALLHFLLHIDVERLEDVAFDALEREVIALTRTWDDELREALVAAYGEQRGGVIGARWFQRLPPAYQAAVDPVEAVGDLEQLASLVDDDEPTRMALRRASDQTGSTHRFLFFKRGVGIELSSFVPILESLGFVVVEELPHVVEAVGDDGGTARVHLHDFGVRLAGGGELDVDADGARVAAAADAIWRQRAEADSLNRLVLCGDLRWEDVAVLRAYRRYVRQIGTSFTEAYQNEALVQHTEVTRALVGLFAARLDPSGDGSAAALRTAREAVTAALEEVQRLDQDRILRRYLGMIEATVRTNRWVERTGERGSAALALKCLSTAVPQMPKPVPHAEIFVYSPELEGVHLRGGPVARGGLRWSDRQEDYRSEVLGLMKAQMVKNAVIVPTGSKGGFVLKRPPSDGAALRAAVREQYQTYIRALLDVTDDVVDGEVVEPPGVRRRDGDDPYLVVAADRGTATFSDVANAISERYGFWLGDAFASGGSRGYDHKAMGITARGAWVAVQRHFRELGVDVQTEPIDMVGVGDMSGDVFGNGALRSRAVRLVAAFDHRDIFIDPDPDPSASFDERQRLFDLPGSSWQDYDRSLLSEGGGVWSRTVKEIVLPPHVRALLRLDVARLSPPELIRAILAAPSDLLLFGGIGTFVKASTETHADVGDRVNDAIRVDASELGARVVGEGGNLAMTQRGRIQYARRGGRCNTDAIDNSAGVDTSDHEVNLKILFRAAQDAGRLEAARRDALLAEMTDDVAAAVLRDVYLQTWAISAELASAAASVDAYEQIMVDLESHSSPFTAAAPPRPETGGRLDREVEVLPSTAEMEERRSVGAGLTRPEIAVLLGYAKVELRDGLIASALPDTPELRDMLVAQFPPAAVAQFDDLLDTHRLRRELIATAVANDLVNRMGVTYVSRTGHELAVAAPDVAAAYWVARQVAAAADRWEEIEALDDRCEPGLQLELKAEVDRVVDAFVRAYLRQGVGDVGARIAADRPAFVELEAAVVALGSPARRAEQSRRAERYIDLGIDESLAERLTLLSDLTITPDVAALAREVDRSFADVADVFFRVNEALPMDYLRERLEDVEPHGRWERWQHRGLLDELRGARRLAAGRILAEGSAATAVDAVGAFLGCRVAAQERVHGMVELLQREEEPSLPALAVSLRVLRDAVTGPPDA
jgi:glutamate dehydrogenase